MPETPKTSGLLTSIKAAQKNHETGSFTDHIRNELVPLYPEERFVAAGSHSIVVDHPLDPKKVLALDYNPNHSGFPLEFSEIYHIHRILSLLYPHNFPRIHASFGGETSSTVRQKIPFHPVGADPSKNPKSIDDIDAYLDYKFASLSEGVQLYKQLVEQAKTDGIDLQLDAGSPMNFIRDDKKNIWYVDLVDNRSDNFTIDIQKAFQRIETLPAEDKAGTKHSLISSLRRLTELKIIKRMYGKDTVITSEEIDKELNDFSAQLHLQPDELTKENNESKARIQNTTDILAK